MKNILNFIKKLDLSSEIQSNISSSESLQHLIIELLKLDEIRLNIIASDRVKNDIIKNNIQFIVNTYNKERLIVSTMEIWHRYVGPLSKKLNYYPKVFFPNGNVAIFDKMELNRLFNLGKVGVKFNKTGGMSTITKIWFLNQPEPNIEISYDPTVIISKSNSKLQSRDMYLNFRDYFHDITSVNELINNTQLLEKITYVNIKSLKDSLAKYWNTNSSMVLEFKAILLRKKLQLENEVFRLQKIVSDLERERILLNQKLVDSKHIDKNNRSIDTYTDKLIMSNRQNDLNKISSELISVERSYKNTKKKLDLVKSKLRIYSQVYTKLDIIIPLL